MGDLVEQAKDYGPTNPSQPIALRQLLDVSSGWAAIHPLLSTADVVTAIPSTREKEFDVPAELADSLSRTHGMTRIWMHSYNQSEQKGVSASELMDVDVLTAQMSVDGTVRRKRVLLLDDVYRSGNTMMAGVKRLRREGASAVYCLALTKTAKFCEGLPAGSDNWPDWDPDDPLNIANDDLSTVRQTTL